MKALMMEIDSHKTMKRGKDYVLRPDLDAARERGGAEAVINILLRLGYDKVPESGLIANPRLKFAQQAPVPKDYPERMDKRVLRNRQCFPGRLTTKVANS
jgi:hypothetical protein